MFRWYLMQPKAIPFLCFISTMLVSGMAIAQSDLAGTNRFQQLDYTIKQWQNIEKENPKATVPENLAQDVAERSILANTLGLAEVKKSEEEAAAKAGLDTSAALESAGTWFERYGALLGSRSEQLEAQKKTLETWQQRYRRDGQTVASMQQSGTWDAAHREKLETVSGDVQKRMDTLEADIADVNRRKTALEGAQKKMAAALGAAGIAVDVRDGKFFDASGKAINLGKIFADKKGAARLDTAAGGLGAVDKLVSGDVLGGLTDAVGLVDDKLPDYADALENEKQFIDVLEDSGFFDDGLRKQATVLRGKAKASLERMQKAQAFKDKVAGIKGKLEQAQKIMGYVDAARATIAALQGTYVSVPPGTSQATARLLGGMKFTGEQLKNLVGLLPPGIKDSIGQILEAYAEALIAGPAIYDHIRSLYANRECENRVRWGHSNAANQLNDSYPEICLRFTDAFKETASLYVNEHGNPKEPKYFFVPDMSKAAKPLSPETYARLAAIAADYSAYATILHADFIMDDATVAAILAALEHGKPSFTVNDGWFVDTTYVIADLKSDAAILLELRSALGDELTPGNARDMIKTWKAYLESVRLTERLCGLSILDSPATRQRLFVTSLHDRNAFTAFLERQGLFGDNASPTCRAKAAIAGPTEARAGEPADYSLDWEPPSALLEDIAQKAVVTWTVNGKSVTQKRLRLTPLRSGPVRITAKAVLDTPLGKRTVRAAEHVVTVPQAKEPGLALAGPAAVETGTPAGITAQVYGLPDKAASEIAWSVGGVSLGQGTKATFTPAKAGKYEIMAELAVGGKTVTASHALTAAAKAPQKETPPEQETPETGQEEQETAGTPMDGQESETVPTGQAATKLVPPVTPGEPLVQLPPTSTPPVRPTPPTDGLLPWQIPGGQNAGSKTPTAPESGSTDPGGKPVIGQTAATSSDGTKSTTAKPSTAGSGTTTGKTTGRTPDGVGGWSSSTSQTGGAQSAGGQGDDTRPPDSGNNAISAIKTVKPGDTPSAPGAGDNYCEKLRGVPSYLKTVKAAQEEMYSKFSLQCRDRVKGKVLNDPRYNPPLSGTSSMACSDDCLTSSVEKEHQARLATIKSQSAEVTGLVNAWINAKDEPSRKKALTQCEARLNNPPEYSAHYPDGETLTFRDACGNALTEKSTQTASVLVASAGDEEDIGGFGNSPATTNPKTDGKTSASDEKTPGMTDKAPEESPAKAVVALKSSSPTSLPLGSTASLLATVTVDGKPVGRDVVVRWEPLGSDGVSFSAAEGPGRIANTATFLRPRSVPVWVVALAKKGNTYTTIGESNQIVFEIKPPALSLKASPAAPLVGEETAVTLTTTPALHENAYAVAWDIKGKALSPGETGKKGGYSFRPAGADPVTVTARVKSLPGGEDLGQTSLTVPPKPYAVTVSVAPAGGKVAPHENATLAAGIAPTPPDGPESVRYAWSVSDGCTPASTITRDIRAKRSEAGSCQATVEIRDARGAVLGSGQGSFTVAETTGSGQKGAQDKPATVSEADKQVLSEITKGAKLCQAGKWQECAEVLDMAITAAPAELKNKEQVVFAKAKAMLQAAEANAKAGQPQTQTQQTAATLEKINQEITVGAKQCMEQQWATCANTLKQALDATPADLKKKEKVIFDKAQALLETALKKNREANANKPAADNEAKCDALWNQAMAKSNGKNYQGAVSTYQQVLALCPDYCSAMNNIGSSLLGLGKDDEAISWFEKAAKCNPASERYKKNITSTKQDIVAQKKEVAKKQQELAALQQQASTESQCESLFQSGVAKGKAGDKPGAVANYREVLSLCPKHCASMNNIGAALDAAGKKSEAIPWFEKASACDPGDALYKKNITSTKQEIVAQNFSSAMSSLSSALPGASSGVSSSGSSGSSGSGGHYSGSLSGGASGKVRLNISGSSVRGEVDGTYKGSRFTGSLSGSVDGGGNIRCRLDGKVESYAFNGEFTGRVSGGSATGSWNAHNKYGSPTGSWRAGQD